MPLNHEFVSAFADGGDATKLRPSNWNDDHVFTGGTAGHVLTRDTGSADGMIWVAPSGLSGIVPATRTVNGYALSGDIALVKADVGLGNVDNTSDANKPVSTAGQTALDLKAPLTSPTFTGTVAVPAASFANAALANMATKTYKGRTSAGTGVPEDVAVATLKADLGLNLVENTALSTYTVPSAMVSFLQSGTGAVIRTVENRQKEVFSVNDFGAVGDGTVDDTASIQACITAAPEGSIIFWPQGRYKTTSAFATIAKALTFKGCGAGSYNAAVFGDGGWSASLETGSIIETTITSGSVFTFDPASTKPFNVYDLCIKGLGDNTRTTIGITFDMNRALWSNVMFLNLEKGFTNATSESDDNLFNQVMAHGCKWGADLGYPTFNQNVFVQFYATSCGTGMRLDGCSTVCVYGGAIQGSTTYGIDGVNLEECTFDGIYFENSAVTNGAIHIKLGDANTIRRCHMSTAADDITIDSAGNLIENPKYGSGTVTLAGVGNRLEGGWPGTVVITGTGSVQTSYPGTGIENDFGALGAATTLGFLLRNKTPATAGVLVQISPRLRWTGTAWNSTSTASETNSFFIEHIPASVAGTITGTFRVGYINNASTTTYPFTINSAGLATSSGGFNSTGAYTAGGTTTSGEVRFNGGIIQTGTTTGLMQWLNASRSTGVGFDVATDAIFKVRTRAQTGYATVDALSYRINGGAGAVGSVDQAQKSVAAIADATLTTVWTITVPNAAHSAKIRVTLVGSLGAGGAIGANEASATNTYDIVVNRTAGVNAVAAISTAYGAAASAVAGAATVTAVLTVGAVSGAVGASNTFPVQVTITKSGGASANHTCQTIAEVLNANATGVTIA